MAQPAEFEEKEYENPLNVELLLDTANPLWTPGQVFEEHFGIDAALFAGNPDFWLLFGYLDIPRGVILDHFRWGYIWRHISSKRPLPTFRSNLLLQTKRPHHRVGTNGYYAGHGISGEYWQFQKTHHQQLALERLYHKLSNRILICYACAAFHTLSDLYRNIDNKTLVNNSTFVQVHRMTNHDKWVYNNPGCIGLACSEIERIEDKPFVNMLNDLYNPNDNRENVLQNLLDLEAAMIESTGELEENPISLQFKTRRDYAYDAIRNVSRSRDDNRALRAFLSVQIFCNLTNTTWFVIG